MNNQANKQLHETIFQECLAVLKSSGIEPREQIQRLVEFFFSSDRHFTLNDFERFADERALGLGRNEIMHTLRFLLEYGFAVRRYFADGREYYEHIHLGEHHDHFYCIRCGAITEFYSPRIEQLQLDEARKNGFHAFTHKMQIHGLCARCFGSTAGQSTPLSMVEPGGAFSVADIDGGEQGRGRRRLMEMGIAPGCAGEVISNAGGMIVVNVGGARLALGRGQGMRVRVFLTN